MNERRLIEAIEREFPESPVPESVLKEGTSQSLYDGVDPTEALLKNKKWNEVVPGSAKADFWYCFTIMSDKAFAYYFSAFLKHSICGEKPDFYCWMRSWTRSTHAMQ